MSEDGKKRLKDLAKQVRDKVTPAGNNVLHEKGLAIVDELANELSSPEGMPGLKVYREGQTKFRLQRAPRNGEITVEWQREIGALCLTTEKQGEPKKLVRYVWDEGPKHWRRMDGGGEIWEDVTAALTETLYPEVK